MNGGGRELARDSLAFALLGAARVCVGVRAGRTLRDGLEAERAGSRPRPNDRAGIDPLAAVHDLAARTLRRRARSDALLLLIGNRVPEPPLMRELIVVAIALLVDALPTDVAPDGAAEASFESRMAGLPYSPYTLVDQAVKAATSQVELARGKGFVNAVLRTLLRRMEQDPSGLAAALERDETRFELPAWWLDRLRTAYPSDWQRVARASLVHPPMTLRVNRRRTTRDALLARFAESDVAARPIGDDGVRLDRPLPVARIPGFSEGLVSVQDEAAQRSARLLDVTDGMRVLDACAAPGGKTGHLLELASLDLVALDVDKARLSRVRDNLDRLGLDATLVAGDARRPDGWSGGRRFDRILADVPCTASGILRRHPDIRWLRRERDIADLSRTAQQITAALWSLLDPGGKLLLVTCSIFPEESARHAADFAAQHADARALPAPGQLLPTGDGRATGSLDQDHDGLFFALFEKMR